MIAPPATWIDAVVVAQPAERRHRPREQSCREHERHREPERVDGEERRSLERGVGRAGEDEDRRQDGADARRRADREGATQENAGATPARLLQETGTDEPLGPRKQPHEREAEDDEHEPRDALEQELVAEDPTTDERRADPEQHEERREPEDERHAARDHAPRRARLPEPVGVDGRDRGEIRRDERQDARREERDHAREERDRNRRPAH